MSAEFKGDKVWSEYYWNDALYLLNPFQISILYFEEMQYCELMAEYANNYAAQHSDEFDVWTHITGDIYMVYTWVRALMSVNPKASVDEFYDEDIGCKYSQSLMSKPLTKRIIKATAMYDVTCDFSNEIGTTYKATGMWQRFSDAAQYFYHMSQYLAYDDTMVKNHCLSGDNKKKSKKPIRYGFEMNKVAKKHTYTFYMLWISAKTEKEFKQKQKEIKTKGGQSVLRMIEDLKLDGTKRKMRPHLVLDVGFTSRALAEKIYEEKKITLTGIVRENASGLPKQKLDSGRKKIQQLQNANLTVSHFHDSKAGCRIISTAPGNKSKLIYQRESIKKKLTNKQNTSKRKSKASQINMKK